MGDPARRARNHPWQPPGSADDLEACDWPSDQLNVFERFRWMPMAEQIDHSVCRKECCCLAAGEFAGADGLGRRPEDLEQKLHP